ncbi:MAG: thiamine pyrophosphate-dependent enzyme [Spirochaetota bacterium]
MKTIFDFEDKIDIAWCPGCGNFSILKALKLAITELNIPQDRLVLVSGIGQAAKTPQYIRANFFNGLHGRSLPAATGIKAANPELTVIAISGDGCTYGEGGNHFIHTIRRNPDIVNIVHNNMVYGLTKGQASPTSSRGFKSPVQVTGVYLEPFNPVAVAISLNASFVARAYAADIEQTKEIIIKAINNRGYSLVDIFQPCVSFNNINTYQWYKENTYYIEDSYDPYDREKAIRLSFENSKFPLGIIYLNNSNKTFEENLTAYENDRRPLFQRTADKEKLKSVIY